MLPHANPSLLACNQAAAAPLSPKLVAPHHSVFFARSDTSPGSHLLLPQATLPALCNTHPPLLCHLLHFWSGLRCEQLAHEPFVGAAFCALRQFSCSLSITTRLHACPCFLFGSFLGPWRQFFGTMASLTFPVSCCSLCFATTPELMPAPRLWLCCSAPTTQAEQNSSAPHLTTRVFAFALTQSSTNLAVVEQPTLSL